MPFATRIRLTFRAMRPRPFIGASGHFAGYQTTGYSHHFMIEMSADLRVDSEFPHALDYRSCRRGPTRNEPDDR